MDIYLIVVIALLLLAVMGLVVGVANDAVNFLNSAQGSKVASHTVIMLVASVGIIIGALTSSGMMEVARSGVFHPSMFTFHEVMMLFLAVMFMNVVLLDVFNSLGMPTSTTVSLVFGLLGAAVGVSVFKITHSGQSMSELGTYINTGKAMAIISGILLSVALAFVCGTVVMYITRLIFSFRYTKKMKTVGALWCGIAITAISYFALIKGLKSTSLIPAATMTWMETHNWALLGLLVAGWSIIMSLLSLLKVNILKITVLAGTFSLALAFAGNDLVNFIGVSVAGYDSYEIYKATGDAGMLMGDLQKPVQADFGILLASGIIMTLTLWFSKKSRTVSETELNLARQADGDERFGSTSFSRAIVRSAMTFSKSYERNIPERMRRFIDSRFAQPYVPEGKDKAPFDLIRATVNLTAASILIAMATSMKLPLSTTYVTFMVAMGTSLADRAWGRESAVYRITGVFVVIAGWFVTALVAFLIAFGIALLLMWGGEIALAGIATLCVYLLVHSSFVHRKKIRKSAAKEAKIEKMTESGSIIESGVRDTSETIRKVIRIYNLTLRGLFNEDRKLLRQTVQESESLYIKAHDRKHEILPVLLRMQDNYLESGHYYIQVVDYLNEMTKALVHITRPSFEHINNNHEGLTKEQESDLGKVSAQVSEIYDKVDEMLVSGDYSALDKVLQMRDDLFGTLAAATKNQIKRVKSKSNKTRGSILYLTIINETKTMVLQTRNLLKSQKYFMAGREN